MTRVDVTNRKQGCGCQEKSPEVSSEDAVWLDPTAYDPILHGPPYLPGREARSKKATGTHPLLAVLAYMRAAAWLHQTHHWQTTSNYSDHLLFDRLYTESLPYIDQLAERVIGVTQDPELLDGYDQMSASLQCFPKYKETVFTPNGFVGSPTPEGLVRHSLEIERALLVSISSARAMLNGNVTEGTDNLLQGIADLHETFIYLLNQRLGNVYTYMR